MPAPPEDAVVADLRATLLSSKTPLRIQDVNSDYKLVNGTSIPFREFGHSSLEEFLIKLKNKGEITMKSEGGNLLVHAAAKASSAHVLKLISKQKDSTKKRSFRGRHGRGGRGVGGGRGSRGGRGGSGSSRGSGQTSAYVSRPPPTSKSYQTSNYQSHNGTRSGYSSGSNYPSYQSQNGTRSHYNDVSNVSNYYGGSNLSSYQSFNRTQSSSHGERYSSNYDFANDREWRSERTTESHRAFNYQYYSDTPSDYYGSYDFLSFESQNRSLSDYLNDSNYSWQQPSNRTQLNCYDERYSRSNELDEELARRFGRTIFYDENISARCQALYDIGFNYAQRVSQSKQDYGIQPSSYDKSKALLPLRPSYAHGRSKASFPKPSGSSKGSKAPLLPNPSGPNSGKGAPLLPTPTGLLPNPTGLLPNSTGLLPNPTGLLPNPTGPNNGKRAPLLPKFPGPNNGSQASLPIRRPDAVGENKAPKTQNRKKKDVNYKTEATQKSGQQGRIYGATPAQDRLKDRLKKLTLNLVEDPQPKLPSYLLHKDEIPSPPLLVIPESDRWDVFVTVAKSTTDVWIKLIGENFSDKFDDLSDEMSLSLADFDEDDHVVSPKVGHYYAVKDGELWNRVKLLSMKGDSCECHLIDVGETDNFSCNELFDLDPLFLDLAAQAVPCTLLNLEKYVGLQSQAYLNVIKGNSFVAVVKSRKMPHSIELYGTGSQDNIHMGEELLLKLDAKNSAPLLPPVGHIQRGDVKTFVSHVSDSGEVALQFHSYHFMIVHDLIESITPEDESRNKVTKLSDISPGTSCLARFSGEAWYRATIVNVTSETDIEVYSQDFGDSHSVPMSELLSLEKLPTLLSLILPQAVTVNLDCLPPAMFSEKLAEKIRKIVPEDEEVLVKTVKGEEIPIVELFIRIKPTNVLVSVNNTILVDPELTKSES